ncbi:MSHA biogenesis protein MshO [Gammaproteobacteria bacterium]
MPNPHLPSFHRGFTLIEAIMVIVITGIIASMIAVFIKIPADGYISATRRAELSDIADTTVRRIARDLRLALPNTVRNPSNGSDQCIEFIPTKVGGRYRAAADNVGAIGGDILDFTAVDNSFDMLWTIANLPAAYRIVAGDIIVVYNDGTTNGNAYLGTNAIQVASVAPAVSPNSTTITFVGPGAVAAIPFNGKQLPSASPTHRFQVIPVNQHVMAYGCTNGTLRRYVRTLGAPWAQPANCAAMIGGAIYSQLAQNIATCNLKYEQPGVNTGLGRLGIVSISLGIDQSGESVNLYHQIHIDTTP